jgi:hypothetical protein
MEFHQRQVSLMEYTPEIIALAVRYKLEGLVKNEIKPFNEFDESLSGLCAIASAALYKNLKKFGFCDNLYFIQGYYDIDCHCWVELNQTIYDITATQFDVKDKVHIVDQANPHYNEWDYVFDINSAFKKWAEYQSPKKERVDMLILSKEEVDNIINQLEHNYV